MWEHWLGCWECVQQDAIFLRSCGYLDHHHIETCAMQARAEGTGTILTNATWGSMTKLCYFCGDVEWRWLERAGVFIGRLLKVVWSLMSMWGVVWWTCMQRVEDAWKVFNKMRSWDVVTWTTILGGCTIHWHGKPKNVKPCALYVWKVITLLLDNIYLLHSTFCFVCLIGGCEMVSDHLLRATTTLCLLRVCGLWFFAQSNSSRLLFFFMQQVWCNWVLAIWHVHCSFCLM